VQKVKAREFLESVEGGMIVIEYAVKFLQLSRFSMYLILNEKKKGEKVWKGSKFSYSDHDELFQYLRFLPVGGSSFDLRGKFEGEYG
jgi:hypothetical protein